MGRKLGSMGEHTARDMDGSTESRDAVLAYGFSGVDLGVDGDGETGGSEKGESEENSETGLNGHDVKDSDVRVASVEIGR